MTAAHHLTQIPSQTPIPHWTHLFPVGDEHRSPAVLPFVSPASLAILQHSVVLTQTSTVVSDGSGGPSHQMPFSPTDRPTQLDEGEVWVEYHPASGKRSEILRPQVADIPIASISPPNDTALAPWHPFITRADFEQAELFLRYDCTDSYINAQLRLIHSGSPLSHSITMQSAKEMHAILAQIPRIEDTLGVRICTE